MPRTKTICILTDRAIHALMIEVSRSGAEVQGRSTIPCVVPDSLGGAGADETQALVDSIVDALRDLGDAERTMTLVLPLQWVYTHVLSGEGKRIDSQTLSFELEPFLPVSLETVTCSFAPLEEDRFLAMAIPTQPMADLIAALEKSGVAIGEITVDALSVILAARATPHAKTVVIRDQRWTRVATGLEGAQPLIASFAALHEQENNKSIPDPWKLRVGRDEPLANDSIILILADAAGADDSNGEQDGRCLRGSDAVDSIACAAANAASTPNVNLRQGSLATDSPWAPTMKLVNHCLQVALALALIITMGLYRQAGTLRDRIEQLDGQRQQVYRQVFDTASIPPGAALRVASQRIRLEGLTRAHEQQGGGTLRGNHRPLDKLRDIVVQLPEDLRLMLLEARLEPAQVTLSGHTKTHRDAERLAEAVSRVPGLTTRTPRTDRLSSGGVSFTVVAGVRTDGD